MHLHFWDPCLEQRCAGLRRGWEWVGFGRPAVCCPALSLLCSCCGCRCAHVAASSADHPQLARRPSSAPSSQAGRRKELPALPQNRRRQRACSPTRRKSVHPASPLPPPPPPGPAPVACTTYWMHAVFKGGRLEHRNGSQSTISRTLCRCFRLSIQCFSLSI